MSISFSEYKNGNTVKLLQVQSTLIPGTDQENPYDFNTARNLEPLFFFAAYRIQPYGKRRTHVQAFDTFVVNNAS